MDAAGGAFRLLSLKYAEAAPVLDGTLEWIPLRRLLEARAFGTNAYRAARAGDLVIEDHVESPGQEEMYVVIAGAARFTIAGEDVDAARGDVVFLPDPEVRRGAVATEDGTIVLGVGGWPDRPYQPLPWEAVFLAEEPMRRGDWDAAAEILETHERRDHPRVQFHLARCLAQMGELARARSVLETAVGAQPALRERAETDELLAPLRAE